MRITEAATDLHHTTAMAEFTEIDRSKVQWPHERREFLLGSHVITRIEQDSLARTIDMAVHKFWWQRVKRLDHTGIISSPRYHFAPGKRCRLDFLEISRKLVGCIDNDALIIVSNLS